MKSALWMGCTLAAMMSGVGSIARAQTTLPSADPALDPPPISLTVENGSVAATARALSQALERPTAVVIATRGTGGASPVPEPVVNIKAEKEPYWTVMLRLRQEAGVWTTNSGRSVSWDQQEPIEHSCTTGGFFMYPWGISRVISTPGDGAGPPADALQLHFYVNADPRINFVAVYNVQLTAAIDEEKRDLLQGGLTKAVIMFPNSGAPQVTLTFPLAAAHGQMITSLKGQLHLTVIDKLERGLIDQPESKVGKLFDLGGQKVMLRAFTLKGSQLNVGAGFASGFSAPFDTYLKPRLDREMITSVSTPTSKVHPPATPTRDYAWALHVLDSAGQEIVRPLQFGQNGDSGFDVTPPVEVFLPAPVKTHDAVVPFEFHDIPVPK